MASHPTEAPTDAADAPHRSTPSVDARFYRPQVGPILVPSSSPLNGVARRDLVTVADDSRG